MTIPAADIEKWKKLADEATPGPWASRHIRYKGFSIDANLMCMNGLRADFSVGNVYARDDAEILMSEGAMATADKDSDFIAAARTAVPALIEEVERLRAQLEKFDHGYTDAKHDKGMASQ